MEPREYCSPNTMASHQLHLVKKSMKPKENCVRKVKMMMMRSGERRHNRQCVRASVTPSSSLYYQQNTTLLTVHTSNTLQQLVITSRHTLWWWWWWSCVAIHKSSIGDESALHWWAGAAVEECVNSLWHLRGATHQLPCDASNVNLIYFFSCCQQIVLSQGCEGSSTHESVVKSIPRTMFIFWPHYKTNWLNMIIV